MDTTKLKLKLVRDYGRSSEICDVQCQEDHGKFYVSMKTLNASNIGVGLSPAEAAADYATKCGATSHLLIADATEKSIPDTNQSMDNQLDAPEAPARPRG